MNLAELNKVATAMVAPGRGILAADESSGTIKKRFDTIGVESSADSRRDYRELMFRANEAMSASATCKYSMRCCTWPNMDASGADCPSVLATGTPSILA